MNNAVLKEKQHQMTEEEYRAAPGLNSTLLGRFWQSPDHALMKMEPKHYLDQGHAFEDILWMLAYGDSSKFDARFFIADLGTPPDKIIQAIEAGTDLATLENLNKDGSRSKTSTTLHAWIDACMEHPGLKPISKAEYDTLCTMAGHMMDMELDPGSRVGDIIQYCDFQVPIFWEKDGIQKKALVDLLLFDGKNYWPFDIKAYASLSKFKTELKSSLWIQELHYSEGVREALGGQYECPMRFWVAEKQAPHLAQQIGLDLVWREIMKEKYSALCWECSEWIKNGRPARGWLHTELVKGWIS